MGFWHSRHPPNVTRAPDGARQLTTLNGQADLQVGIGAYSATIVSSLETEFERRAIEGWGKLLGNNVAVTALLDRFLHHGHILTRRPRSWRTNLPAEQ
jgi:IstB-like ATP binding protein